MATRYVDYVDKNNNFKEIQVPFKWYPGFATSQMRRSVQNLHRQFKKVVKDSSMNILEVSSVSNIKLGTHASAFNLDVKTSRGIYKAEQLFQAGKVYKDYGSMKDSLKLTPKEAKQKSFRVNENDQLTKFSLFGSDFPLTPRTYFYDWIYVHGLIQHPDIYKELLKYDAFTDIYANPKRTINSQAKSCAIFVSLYRKYGTKKLLALLRPNNKKKFKQVVYG